jgi:hypothetical protein
VLRGGEEGSGDAEASYLLVAPFKHGADDLVATSDGRAVRLRGTLVKRDGRRMIEVVPGSIEVTMDAFEAADEIPIGEIDLVGEIVDSKCWLGVMKPARGNVHRGCAARCLSGGIPPLLMTQDSTGAMIHVLLTGEDGQPAHRHFAELVGRRLTVRGQVIREGDLLLMRVEAVEE